MALVLSDLRASAFVGVLLRDRDGRLLDALSVAEAEELALQLDEAAAEVRTIGMADANADDY